MHNYVKEWVQSFKRGLCMFREGNPLLPSWTSGTIMGFSQQNIERACKSLFINIITIWGWQIAECSLSLFYLFSPSNSHFIPLDSSIPMSVTIKGQLLGYLYRCAVCVCVDWHCVVRVTSYHGNWTHMMRGRWSVKPQPFLSRVFYSPAWAPRVCVSICCVCVCAECDNTPAFFSCK